MTLKIFKIIKELIVYTSIPKEAVDNRLLMNSIGISLTNEMLKTSRIVSLST